MCDRCDTEEQNSSKRVCCGQPPSLCHALIHGTQLSAACLNMTDDDLTENRDCFSRTAVPDSIEDCSNRQLRLLSYRKAFRIIHGVGQGGVKVPLGNCIVSVIGDLYPGQ